MDTSYNKEEDKYKGMTLDSKPSTPDPHNTDQSIDSDDETETTDNFWENTMKPRLTTTIPFST